MIRRMKEWLISIADLRRKKQGQFLNPAVMFRALRADAICRKWPQAPENQDAYKFLWTPRCDAPAFPEPRANRRWIAASATRKNAAIDAA